MTGSPDAAGASASARLVKRRSPRLFSAPWHSWQRWTKMGRTSRSKSTDWATAGCGISPRTRRWNGQWRMRVSRGVHLDADGEPFSYTPRRAKTLAGSARGGFVTLALRLSQAVQLRVLAAQILQ